MKELKPQVVFSFSFFLCTSLTEKCGCKAIRPEPRGIWVSLGGAAAAQRGHWSLGWVRKIYVWEGCLWEEAEPGQVRRASCRRGRLAQVVGAQARLRRARSERGSLRGKLEPGVRAGGCPVRSDPGGGCGNPSKVKRLCMWEGWAA